MRIKTAMAMPGHLPGRPEADAPRPDGGTSEDMKMRALPIVNVNGRQYFLDERLMELRSVTDVNDRIPLKDYHVFYYRLTGRMVLD